MANPFQNAFTNYESSGNQANLGNASSGGFNPNTVTANSAPWTPPPPTGGGLSAKPLPTIPFGSYGSGAEGPAQNKSAGGGGYHFDAAAWNKTHPNVQFQMPKGGNPQQQKAVDWLTGGSGGGGGIQLGPVMGDPGQPPPGASNMPVQGGNTWAGAPEAAFGAASGGAIPAFDDGGSNDGQMSAMDMGGGDPGSYYSSNQQSDQTDNTNYSVDLASALGDVLDTLQASRDQVSMPISGGDSGGEGSDQVAVPENIDQATGASGPPSNPGGQDVTPPQPPQGAPPSGSQSNPWNQRRIAANDEAPSQSQSQIGNQQWGPGNQRPTGQPAPRLDIGPQVPAGHKTGSFGRLASLGNEGTQFMAQGGSVGTKAYQDGGANDPGEDDAPSGGLASATGAIPDTADDTAGDPSALEQQDQQAQAQANPQLLARYASGADAVSPDVAAAVEQQVDPQGQMDPVARRMAAISSAVQQGDKKLAKGLLDHNRNSFNAKRHAARAALDRGNHQEAVRLANSAMQHVPNGHSVHISATGNGVHIASRSLVKKAKR